MSLQPLTVVNASTHEYAGQSQWMYMPTRKCFFRLALTTFGVQQQILNGMAVPPSDPVAWTLRGAKRVAIKVADVTLLRTAAPTGPTRLFGWLTLWPTKRTVVVVKHLNRRANTTTDQRMVNEAAA
jgi:hypothetical protein